MSNIDLVPNYALRNAIRAWAQRRGLTLPEPEFFPPPRTSGALYKSSADASFSTNPNWDPSLPAMSEPAMAAVVKLYSNTPSAQV